MKNVCELIIITNFELSTSSKKAAIIIYANVHNSLCNAKIRIIVQSLD